MRSISQIPIILLLTALSSGAIASEVPSDTICVISPSQLAESSLPRPVAGWDAFKQTLVYPDEERQAGVGCAFELTASTDSSGTVKKIKIYGSDPPRSFLTVVERSMNSTRWIPARGTDTLVRLDVMFVPGFSMAFIIESEPTRIGPTVVRFTHPDKFDYTYGDTTITPDSAYLFTVHPQNSMDGKLNGPRPVAGWDSLVRRFSFSPVTKILSWGPSFLAVIGVDSSGKTSTVDIEPRYPAFTESIDRILKGVEWIPAKEFDRSVPSHISLPILFFLRGGNMSELLRIVVGTR